MRELPENRTLRVIGDSQDSTSFTHLKSQIAYIVEHQLIGRFEAEFDLMHSRFEVFEFETQCSGLTIGQVHTFTIDTGAVINFGPHHDFQGWAIGWTSRGNRHCDHANLVRRDDLRLHLSAEYGDICGVIDSNIEYCVCRFGWGYSLLEFLQILGPGGIPTRGR